MWSTNSHLEWQEGEKGIEEGRLKHTYMLNAYKHAHGIA